MHPAKVITFQQGVVIGVLGTRPIERDFDPDDPMMRCLAMSYSLCLCSRLFHWVPFEIWDGKFLDADAGRFRIVIFDIRQDPVLLMTFLKAPLPFSSMRLP